MNLRRGAIATSGLLLVAAIAVGVWLAASRPARDAAGAIRDASPLAVPLPRTFDPAVRASGPTTQHSKSAISAALQQEFLDAPDLRAFALQAMRRPAEGGLFYARMAGDWCQLAQPAALQWIEQGVRSEIEQTGTIGSVRLATIERIHRRCAGFIGTARDELHASIRAEAGNRADPLLNAETDMRSAKRGADPEAWRAAMQALVDLHDPLLLSHNWTFLASIGRFGDRPPAGMWFDGQNYRNDNAGIYQQALELATCTPGAPCAMDDQILMTCTIRDGPAFCAKDPTDFFLNYPGAAERPPAYDDAVMELAGRMHAAIDRGDVRRFMPPPAGR